MQRTGEHRGLLRTHIVLIGLVTFLTLAGTMLAIVHRPAHYVSTAKVLVRPESIGGGAPVVPSMGTERQVAESGKVAKLASTRLGLSPRTAIADLSVGVEVDTNVLDISYSASTPNLARQGAGVFSRAYVAIRDQGSHTLPATPGTKTAPAAAPPVASIITAATLPTAPAKPNYPLLLGLSLMVGLMLGAGCAFVWDRLSGRLRGSGDVEAQTGLPVLASVPKLRAGLPEDIVVLANPPVPGAKAYGHLTARIMHLLEAREASSLLVTSPSKGAGKTSVAVNLAASLAALGKQTVLVSMDGGSLKLHECFGLDREPGLLDVLHGTTSLARALHTTRFPGIKVLTSGTVPDNGTAPLNIEDLALLVGRLSMSGEVVIFDGPSVLANPETALVAAMVDLVVLVVDMKRGSRADAAAAVSLLGDVKDSVVGVVANRPGRRHRPHPGWPVASQGAVTSQSDVHTGSEQAKSETLQTRHGA
ncbi:MAG: polysaccharide biosynthesis transport protein [Nocardioidaceae bacterium]|jgi:capsular exopolysaccharide synthesis family protein|nr:polysaccharide biosynthesis transport protein [Nocardioidaceae bacterium]